MSEHKLLSLYLATVLLTSVVFTAVAIAPVAAAGNATDISSCTTINEPGTYNVGNDFSVNSIGQTDGCLVIDSSDVVLDGRNHTITGPDNQTGYAIEITNTHFSNITIRNLSAEQWREGIRWHTTQSSLIENFTTRNTLRGIGAYNSQGTLIQHSRFINSSGITGNGNQNISVQNSSFIGTNTGTGINVESTSLDVKDNYFGDISTGVDSPNATIEDNHFVGSGQGIDLLVRKNVTIRNNTFEQNWAAITLGGVKTTDPPTRTNNVTIVDNSIRNATGYALRLSAVQNVTVEDNVITNATRGIRFSKVFHGGVGIENSTVVNNSIGGSAEYHVQLNGGVNLSTTRFENLYLPHATVTSLSGTDFQMAELDGVPEDPPHSKNLSAYVNVSQIGGWANLTVGYNESALNESNLTVWRNHNGSWINETSNASINMGANTVRLNLSESSILAPMEQVMTESNENGGDGDGSSTIDPNADLTASSMTVKPDEPVEFDASGSTDNNQISQYNWDFDGDGTVDATTTSATTTHSYESSGTYSAEVEVVDGNSNTDTEIVSITVESAESRTSGSESSGGVGSTNFNIQEQSSETPTEGGGSRAQVTIQSYQQGDELSVPVENVGTDTVTIEEVKASFDMGTNIENKMDIRSGNEPPENVPKYGEGDEVNYVSVDIDGNLKDRVISGSITVQLAEDRMPEDPSQVTAKHYKNGEWTPVEMDHLGDQRFEIQTSDYSTFTIILQQEEETTTTTTTTTETETPTAPTTEEPETTVKTTTADSVATTTPPETQSKTPGFGFVASLLALLGLALLARRGNE